MNVNDYETNNEQRVIQLANDTIVAAPEDDPLSLLRCAVEILGKMDTTCMNARDAYTAGQCVTRAIAHLSSTRSPR